MEGKVEGGEWEILYTPRSEHDLLRSKLRYRRLQFMFVDVPRRRKPGRIVGRLADRIAPEVFEARPDIARVRREYQTHKHVSVHAYSFPSSVCVCVCALFSFRS